MYITQETDYAIRIVDYLGRASDLRSGKEVSEEMSVPIRFARNILQKLVGREIVSSYKGIHGGYQLAKLPEEISLYDVFEALDEPIIMNRCMRKSYKCTCSPDKQCVYRGAFMKMSEELTKNLRSTKFTTGGIVVEKINETEL